MVIEFSRNYLFIHFCKKKREKEDTDLKSQSFKIAKMHDEGMEYLSDGMSLATKIF